MQDKSTPRAAAPAATQPRTDRTRAKPDERAAMMGLNAVYESLDKHTKPLAQRLAQDPYAMRNLKSAKTAVRRAIDVAVDSIDDDSAAYIYKNSANYEIVIRPRSVVKDPEWMYARCSDLEVIIELALQADCATCMRTAAECKQCKLRKVLINLTDEPASHFGCGFKGATLHRRDGKR